jgi:hypothetical protein
MNKRDFISGYRLFFGILAAVAIIVQLAYGIQHGASIDNFFSFFTIESNILAVFVLLLSNTFQGKRWELVRGAATLYMTTTGLIYVFLLSGLEQSLQTTIPWVNAVLHYVTPVIMFLDWFIDKPKNYISFKTGLYWVAFPLAYLAYSLVRGAITNWYPYPFLNPSQHGYLGVAATSLIITPIMVTFVWFFAQASRSSKSKKR